MRSFFAFCLVAIASFVLFTFTNVALAQEEVKTDVVEASDATADDCGDVVVKKRHHACHRHIPKFRIPRFEFPEIKFPTFDCCLSTRFAKTECDCDCDEEVAADCCCGGKVVFERNISLAKRVKHVKYVKFPHRFFPKRIVKVGRLVDVEP
ncbi:MAG: hypothetical protein LBH59_03535 [Planctomycetaceae bacterium]|nr:hypothetical protein [Planctomycetaceae bacterium]